MCSQIITVSKLAICSQSNKRVMVEMGKLSNAGSRVRHQKSGEPKVRPFLCWTSKLWVFASKCLIISTMRIHNFFVHTRLDPSLMFMNKKVTGPENSHLPVPDGCEFCKNRNEHKEGSRPENSIVFK